VFILDRAVGTAVTGARARIYWRLESGAWGLHQHLVLVHHIGVGVNAIESFIIMASI